jgi:shikimate dehydrogenase
MRAAVLGSPIAHSLSPVLHAAAYRQLGLDGWTYEAIECDEARLPGLLASLGPEWAGLSLTMPLKRAVLPLLDWTDPLAAEVGAANTVVISGGAMSGYNTDVPGMVTALADAGVLADRRPAAGAGAPAGPPVPADRRPAAGPGVLVLGGGATACSALAALHRAGVSQVTVAVRDQATTGPLKEVSGRLGIRVRLVPFATGLARAGWLRDHRDEPWQLVLSTVPAAAADGYGQLLAAGRLTAGAVFDVVYHPWPTALAAAASAAGAAVISGFELLLQQAAGQVQLMTGQPAPLAAMREAGLAALAGQS